MVKLKEYLVTEFNTSFSVLAFDINDVTLCYPNASKVTITGTHDFFGDGSTTAQSLTKATPIASSFTGIINTSSGSSHTTVPETADLEFASRNSVAFHGPYGCIAYLWEIDGFQTLYDQDVTYRFENAGTFVVKLTCISDGGEADPQYMKLTVT